MEEINELVIIWMAKLLAVKFFAKNSLLENLFNLVLTQLSFQHTRTQLKFNWIATGLSC